MAAALVGGAACDADSVRLENLDFLNRLDRQSQFERLAGGAGELKYLAPLPGGEDTAPLSAPCYFQNMTKYPWHLDFLRTFPGMSALTYAEYSDRVMRGRSRCWWGGALRHWPTFAHPRTGVSGLVTFEVYTVESDLETIGVSEIVQLSEILHGCAGFARDRLAYLPTGAAAESVAAFYRDALAARGVDVVLPSELVATVAEVYSAGEGYGYLRVVPRGAPLPSYGPRDVLVVQGAPLEISIVAGLLSEWPQSHFSHVNLRLREKDIPCASVPGLYDDGALAALDGALVRVVADELDVSVSAATIEDAQAFWDRRQVSVGAVSSDLSQRDLRSFAELRAVDAPAFGSKAANLGELHSILSAENRTEGFGIPVVHYADFLGESGLDARVEALLQDPRILGDAAHRRAALAALRREVRGAPLPDAFAAALFERLVEIFGPEVERRRLKFRSSSNAEDLSTWSGAGLYDSYAGCLGDDLDGDELGPSRCLSAEEASFKRALLKERIAQRESCGSCPWLEEIIDELEEDLTEERPVAEAVRKTWASLWNERAFDEREYLGVDHRQALMGIAVNPSFVLEELNAVAATNLATVEPGRVYRVLTQLGHESVVAPADPASVPETLVLLRGEGDRAPAAPRLVSPSSLAPRGESLWRDDELVTLASLLYQIHDHFAAAWGDESEPRFELEIKKDAAGHIVFKQVRPYLSAW